MAGTSQNRRLRSGPATSQYVPFFAGLCVIAIVLFGFELTSTSYGGGSTLSSLRGWQNDGATLALFADNPDDRAALKEQEEAAEKEGGGRTWDGEHEEDKAVSDGGSSSQSSRTTSSSPVKSTRTITRTSTSPSRTTIASSTTIVAPSKAQTYAEAALEKSQEHGLVFLHLLNEGYIEMTRSWICNVIPLQTVLQKTLFLVTDQNAYDKLKDWKPELNVFLVPYDTPKSMQYGQKVYYQYMQFRTRLYLKLLKAGVKLWIVEADAVWFKDPSSFVLNEPSYDLLTGQDGGLGDDIPEAGFLFLNPTPTTVKMWTALESQLTRTLDSSNDANMGDGGSEMLMLGDMLRGSKDIKWKYLPNKHFCGGKWYQGGPLKEQSDPVVIQNNWIIGNSAKMARAKKWKHWYLEADGETCIERS